MLSVTREITIDRPVEVVRSQFGDIAHHAGAHPHKGVTFTVIEDAADHCDYEQVTKAGPVRLRQRFHLDRHDPARQVNELVDGAFAPGSITFQIDPAGESASKVTAVLEAPGTRLTSVLGPVLRPMLGRGLAKALEEDRAILESGSYESAS